MQPEIQYSSQSALSVTQNKVLRNTYLLLALTMVPTVIGAFVGLSTTGIIMQHPIMATLLMLGAIVGLQFAIAANRNSGLGVVLLLGMTFKPTANNLAPTNPPTSVSLTKLAAQYRDFPLFRAPQVLINALSVHMPTLVLAASFGAV
ncbi:MAG: hypothetical protein ABI619_13305, partial [Betaproteobacteria bacterium]